MPCWTVLHRTRAVRRTVRLLATRLERADLDRTTDRLLSHSASIALPMSSLVVAVLVAAYTPNNIAYVSQKKSLIWSYVITLQYGLTVDCRSYKLYSINSIRPSYQRISMNYQQIIFFYETSYYHFKCSNVCLSCSPVFERDALKLRFRLSSSHTNFHYRTWRRSLQSRRCTHFGISLGNLFSVARCKR